MLTIVLCDTTVFFYEACSCATAVAKVSACTPTEEWRAERKASPCRLISDDRALKCASDVCDEPPCLTLSDHSSQQNRRGILDRSRSTDVLQRIYILYLPVGGVVQDPYRIDPTPADMCARAVSYRSHLAKSIYS